MKVKLIGIFDGKLEDSDEREVNTSYDIRIAISKEDFDNGKIEGIKFCGQKFFYMQEDLGFVIDGEHYELPLEEDTYKSSLTKEELKFLDSLEKGDVITFDVDLHFEFQSDMYHLSSLESSICVDNIEKYEDRYAADKIDYLAEEQPSYLHDILDMIHEIKELTKQYVE